jgi:NADPH:quinone reductase-like Zn-dependent oxidoreductase
VAVRAAGVNPIDWKRRSGLTPPGQPVTGFPVVFGNEVAGVVTRVGDGVTGWAPGDEVLGNPLDGGYAEYALLPAATAAHKPATLPFVVAATLPVAAATACDALHQLALPPGAVLLITGVAGGVGTFAAQLARHRGVTVLGTAADSRRDYAESLGARHVGRDPATLADRVAAVAPDGPDAVLDLAGGPLLEAAAALLAGRGKLVSAADRAGVTRLGGAPVARRRGTAVLDLAGGPLLEAAAALLAGRGKLVSAADRAGVTRLGGAPVARRRGTAVLDEVAALAAEGVLRPHVAASYPLGRAAEALRAAEAGLAPGKTVITVTP